MANYQSAYTGAQIDTAVEKINALQVPSTAEIKVAATSAFNEVQPSSTSASGNGFTCYCYKWGRIAFVTIIGGSASSALAQGATIMTLPSGYAPIQTVEMVDSYNSTHPRIRVLNDGTINTPGALASGTNIRISGCYITAS